MAGLDDEAFAGKLSNVGLTPKRASATPAAFLDDYVASRSDVKGSTATVFGRTRRNLIEFFGPEKPLREITPGDADRWRLYLYEEGLAENTVRRRSGIAKQFFRSAVRRKLTDHNPFADLTAAVRANPSRFYFLTRQDAAKVLDACPDAEWRLLFALVRYGGLRTPSESLKLRWEHVNWAENRFTVHSPKTEHHPGGETRIVPIFPELRPFLEADWESAPVGAEYVITRYRGGDMNLRTQLTKIIKRAGLKPWPKLWQNLRSTRETELAEAFPLHVVCDWIGNSLPVAAKHYLQVTDDHFAKAAQDAAQQANAELRSEPHERKQKAAEQACLPVPAALCDLVQMHQLGGTGLEPVTSTV